MGKQIERWATIFNLFGEQTVAEGLVCCAWEAPPTTYDPAAEDKEGVGRAVKNALRELKGKSAKDAEDQAIAAYGVTPPGALRLDKGQEMAMANGKAVILIGNVALTPADLHPDPDIQAERVYVRKPDIIRGGYLPFLYPAELGTHAEYLARYERFSSHLPKEWRVVLWSFPSPLPIAA